MQPIISSIFLSFITLSCFSGSGESKPVHTIKNRTDSIPKPGILPPSDSIIPKKLKDYENLVFLKVEKLAAASGTKSVLFNTNSTRLYAMNLEGMSVYEFSQPTRKIVREFKFKPTQGTGWNYALDKPIVSFEEKPVEACFTNNDKILWVSLHNAGGIVPIFIDSIQEHKKQTAIENTKLIYLIDKATGKKDSFRVPLIKTGSTPKIISRTADSKNILVSNWHSESISVLSVNEKEYPYGKLIKDIPVTTIPRGIAVDDSSGKSYVAQMGGSELTVINNKTWEKDSASIQVASNPRHVVMDNKHRLFVSYNKLATVACIDAATGKTLFSTKTKAQPRTIILSKNHKFLFATCYSGNSIDVFKIRDDHFEKLYSLECKGSPVGVDIYEDDDKLEAWVCAYTKGTINIYTFTKK
jgi:DNA-binding beta-propeller fold protein YncE